MQIFSQKHLLVLRDVCYYQHWFNVATVQFTIKNGLTPHQTKKTDGNVPPGKFVEEMQVCKLETRWNDHNISCRIILVSIWWVSAAFKCLLVFLYYIFFNQSSRIEARRQAQFSVCFFCVFNRANFKFRWQFAISQKDCAPAPLIKGFINPSTREAIDRFVLVTSKSRCA